MGGTLDRHQEQLLRLLAERLQAELGLDEQATCAVLADLLSDVAAEDLEREVVKRDPITDEIIRVSEGKPETRKVGRPHDGYAPDWLTELLQPHFSPRHHWVEGVERAGFGPSTSLKELHEALDAT